MLEYGRANVRDIQELTQLRLDYLKTDFGEIGADTEQAISANLPSYFAEHIEKDVFAFVARENGRIIATALLVLVMKPCSPKFIRGRIGEVLSVYTLPVYRRKGIATRLMEELIAFSKEQEFDFLQLKATESGYPVYRKLGFQESPESYILMRYMW